MVAAMATTDSTMKTKKNFQPRILIIGLNFILLSGAASAQGLDFEATIRVGASKTDNIYLVPAPDETEQTVYRITPALSLDYENQRIDAVIRYQFNWYKYDEVDRTDRYHRYDAGVTGELVDETLFLEIGASRFQAVIDPDGTIPPGNLPISNNTTDPRFDKTFGGSVTTRASYRYAEVRFDDEAIQGNTNENASFGIENYRNGQGFTWAARYAWWETQYDVSPPWEYRIASAELGFWANAKTRVFASGGKESAWDDPIDRSLQDEFWEAGFAYNNGDKMSAEFAAGERSFGSSWRGELDFSFQRGVLAFSYAETPTTVGRDRYSPGNLLDPEEPEDLLTQPGRAESYISKRGQASLNLNFRRTGFRFIIFDEERIGLHTSDGTELGDTAQNGASASFTWQVGARTEFSARGTISDRGTGTASDSRHIRATILANYRLGSSAFLTLSYDYSEQDPEDPDIGRDYEARVVSVFVSYRF